MFEEGLGTLKGFEAEFQVDPGAKPSAPALFQRIMESLLRGIAQVMYT